MLSLRFDIASGISKTESLTMVRGVGPIYAQEVFPLPHCMNRVEFLLICHLSGNEIYFTQISCLWLNFALVLTTYGRFHSANSMIFDSFESNILNLRMSA